MMHVIVIDDLIHVVKGIIAGVDWKQLHVDSVYEAYNGVQAKKVFEENEIHVMICDIEMPFGNGLELFEWVREHSPQTKCIFLTSHSEFEYAKSALKLGSFDYLLQPIKYEELEKVVASAINQVRKDLKDNTYYNFGILWEDNQNTILAKYWQDVLNGVYKGDMKKIIKAAAHVDYQITENDRFLLIYIHVLRREVSLSDWDDDLLRYTLSNILAELLDWDIKRLRMVQMDSGKLILVIDESETLPVQNAEHILNLFIHQCFKDIKCSIACYCGDYSVISLLPDLYRRMLIQADDNVACTRKVYKMGEMLPVDYELEIPEIKRWETMLQQGDSKVKDEVKSFLSKLLEEEKLNSAALFKFQQEFMRMFYSVTEAKQFNIHLLFEQKGVSELFTKSLNSIYNMLEFMDYILSFPLDQEHVDIYYKSSIDTVKEYIHDNLERDLTRNELAERVFLNPEYLSRLFKKETGLSLTTYITNERMNSSKELLIRTDMSISIIASKVGYSNFSHFSYVFRKVIGCSPIEFRQNHR